tara:strand:+ start:63 stop:449 length:387 start_codon:yes stop_codon:yes gene_type:complete
MEDYSMINDAIDMCELVAEGDRASCIAAINSDVTPHGEFIVNSHTGEIELSVFEQNEFTTIDIDSLDIGCMDENANNYDSSAVISGVCEFDQTTIIIDNAMDAAKVNKGNLLLLAVVAIFIGIKILKK